jgi:2,5-diamino-6-(ribosylamino)-4(3H)-pyrimidinone 5'-phosphate reductase
MNNLPRTTLFMISSLDGKISSGDTDKVDVDQDWKTIKGVKEGLQQYFDLEKGTDVVSFNTGKVMAKVGMNDRKPTKDTIPVRFVLVDNKPHLRVSGLKYLSSWLKHVFIVTTNEKHPAFVLQDEIENISVIYYEGKIDFTDLFKRLKKDYSVHRMTIQSGGTMNSILIRESLIDRVSLVVAPLLVGGATTSTLADGEAVHSVKELSMLRPLKLVKGNRLKHSYLHLIYKVLN